MALCIYMFLTQPTSHEVYLPQNDTYSFKVNTFFYDCIDINGSAQLFEKINNKESEEPFIFSGHHVKVTYTTPLRIARLYSNASGNMHCHNEAVILEWLWTSPSTPNLDKLSCDDMEKKHNYARRCDGGANTNIHPDNHGDHNLLIIMFCPHHFSNKTEELKYNITLNETVYTDTRNLSNGVLPFLFSDLFSTSGSEIYIRTAASECDGSNVHDCDYVKLTTLTYHPRVPSYSILIGSIILVAATLVFSVLLLCLLYRLKRRIHVPQNI